MPRELSERVPTLEEEIADTDAGAAGDTAATDAAAEGAGDGAESAAGADAGAAEVGTDADAADAGGGDAADTTAAAGAESGAATTGEAGEDGKGQSSFVPVSRFNEINERRKAAEDEARQLREVLGNLTSPQARAADTTAAATTPAEQARDFDKELDALQTRYDDGELNDAEFKREERKLLREQTRAEVLQEISPVINDVTAERDRLRSERVQAELDQESAKAIERFPFLDSKAENANKEAITAVLAERDALIRAGIAVGKALRMAVNEVAPKFGAAAASAAAATKDGDGKTPDEVAARRRAGAAAAAAKVEGTQPPQVAGVGNGPRTVSSTPLSASVKDHDKWEKIPEAERVKALGA